jgi:hypothetical protein
MHDLNRFELQNRSRLPEIYTSVDCPQDGCVAKVGEDCRNVGAAWGTLNSQTPREPHQVRKLVAIDAFLSAAGVGVPAPHPESAVVVETAEKTDMFDGQPAPWKEN